jgi:hypothetical protein
MRGRVHTFHAIRPSFHQACQWRDFALLARSCALGESQAWARLKSTALNARGMHVFGQDSDGNPCRQLIAASIEACESERPNLIRLSQCADAVMGVHSAWSMVNDAERRRG